jgi:hypothetical protein
VCGRPAAAPEADEQHRYNTGERQDSEQRPAARAARSGEGGQCELVVPRWNSVLQHLHQGIWIQLQEPGVLAKEQLRVHGCGEVLGSGATLQSTQEPLADAGDSLDLGQADTPVLAGRTKDAAFVHGGRGHGHGLL